MGWRCNKCNEPCINAGIDMVVETCHEKTAEYQDDKKQGTSSVPLDLLVSKPKLRWCHECGRKLMGNHHTLLKNKEDGHTRQFHKACAKELLKPIETIWEAC